jgi:hypothetical protein
MAATVRMMVFIALRALSLLPADVTLNQPYTVNQNPKL